MQGGSTLDSDHAPHHAPYLFIICMGKDSTKRSPSPSKRNKPIAKEHNDRKHKHSRKHSQSRSHSPIPLSQDAESKPPSKVTPEVLETGRSSRHLVKPTGRFQVNSSLLSRKKGVTQTLFQTIKRSTPSSMQKKQGELPKNSKKSSLKR